MPLLKQEIRSETPVSRAYRYLFSVHDGRTKQEVAAALGLSMPTVHQALNALIERGLVCQGKERPSTGGRRATTYQVDGEGFATIGFSLASGSIRHAAFNLMGDRLTVGERPYDEGLGWEDVGKALAARIEELRARPELAGCEVVRVGVALPALAAQAEAGLGALASQVPYGMVCDKDSVCAAAAEWFMDLPEEQAAQRCAYLALEHTVSGAINVGGPYHGMNGREGSFGHLIVEPGGRPCSCGGAGHLQAYCSTDCISSELGMTLDEFFSALAGGDARAQEAWDSFADHLAIGIVQIRMALDADVVLGGVLASRLRGRYDDIRRRVAALDPFSDDAAYVRGTIHPFNAVPIGAAYLAMDNYVSSI